MLVHHADAGRKGGFGVAGRQRPTEDFDVTGVCRVVTEKDGNQRRFARTVFAEQRKNFALVEGEGNRVVGDQRAEALGDAGESKDRRSHQENVSSVQRGPRVRLCRPAGAVRWKGKRRYTQ